MGIVTELFSNMTNPLAIFSCLVVGIAPLVGAALIGGFTSLLKGILGGLAEKQKRKRKETWMSKIKPEGKYSQGRDPVIRQAISNMFATRGLKDPYEDTLGKLKGGG